MPKVAFVVPVWDGDAYLAETIESIRRQSFKDIEIIVIDDCSPDFTPELMDWYVKKDNRIRYHRFEKNEGVREARNYGNKMATADLICVSDQDDLSTHHRALYSYLFFKAHPEVNCLTSAYWECDVDGSKIKHYIPDTMDRKVFEDSRFVWFHSSACYRKEDILALPYKDSGIGATDDWDLLNDWTKEGKQFYTAKHTLGLCRRVPWGQMQQRRAAQGSQPSYIL